MLTTWNLHLGSKTLAMEINILHSPQYLSNFTLIEPAISLMKKVVSSNALSITCLTLQTYARYKLVVRYSLPEIICVATLKTSKVYKPFAFFPQSSCEGA